MVAEGRRAGPGEVWGGNYGVLTPEVVPHVEEPRLAGVMIGIESMAQEELNALNKRSNVDKLHETVELCRRHGIVTIGFYIIGLESDTEESIRARIEELAAMRFDLVQVCIRTPLPQTPLWQRIQDCYGIDDRDYSHFDGKHLVWRHPSLSKGQIEGLLDWSFETLYPRTDFARTIVKRAGAHARTTKPRSHEPNPFFGRPNKGPYYGARGGLNSGRTVSAWHVDVHVVVSDNGGHRREDM